MNLKILKIRAELFWLDLKRVRLRMRCLIWNKFILLNWYKLVWKYRLIRDANEFDICFEHDTAATLQMSPNEYKAYSQEIEYRRAIAHRFTECEKHIQNSTFISRLLNLNEAIKARTRLKDAWQL